MDECLLSGFFEVLLDTETLTVGKGSRKERLYMYKGTWGALAITSHMQIISWILSRNGKSRGYQATFFA